MAKSTNAVIQEIVGIIYQNKAHDWSVQDKGVLLAAVKLALQKPKREQKESLK